MAGPKFEEFGKTIYESIVIYYALVGFIVVIVTSLLVSILLYIKKKKENNLGENKNDESKFVSWRISIIVLIGALILIASPFIMGFLL